MTDLTLEQRARFETWLCRQAWATPIITVEQGGGAKGDTRYMSPSTRQAWSAWQAALQQAQQPACQYIVTSDEGTSHCSLAESAQQPGAQAVGAAEIGAKGFTIARFKDTDVPLGTKLYTHPQPPSIPEPSDEDVWSGCAAFDASPASAGCGIYGSDAILDVLTTYTARLRERIGGGR